MTDPILTLRRQYAAALVGRVPTAPSAPAGFSTRSSFLTSGFGLPSQTRYQRPRPPAASAVEWGQRARQGPAPKAVGILQGPSRHGLRRPGRGEGDHELLID